MNGSKSKTGHQELKLKRRPFLKGSLKEILQQGAGSSGTSVRFLDATREPAGKIQVKGREEPMVQDQPETQQAINPPGSSDTDVPLQGTSTSSIPAKKGVGTAGNLFIRVSTNSLVSGSSRPLTITSWDQGAS
jgi:hypothetical protein